MINSRTFLVVLFFLLALPAAAMADDWLVSLYRTALEHDPGLGVAQSRLEAARQDQIISRANLLPKAEAAAGANYINSSTYNYIPGVLQGEFFGYNYSFIVRQPIFNGAAWSSLASSRVNVLSADATTTLVHQELMLRVGETALTAMKARVMSGYYEGEQRLAKELLEYAEAALIEGTEDIIARNEARARYDEARALLVKANNEQRIADSDLAITVGSTVATLNIPRRLRNRLPEATGPATADAWMSTAESTHPALIRAKSDLEAAGLDVESANRGHWPVLDLSGGYTASKGSTFLPNVETRQWVTGLNINVPLFESFGTSARADRARAVRSEKGHSLESVRDDVRRKIDSALLMLENAVAIVDAINKRLESEAELLLSVEQKYSLGLIALPEKINAERRVASAHRDLDTNLLDARIVWLHLRSAAGQLKEDDLIELGR